MSRINEVIATKIKQSGLKKNYVAEQVGITPSTMTRIITGKRKVMADELISFCSVLSVDISEFRQSTQN